MAKQRASSGAPGTAERAEASTSDSELYTRAKELIEKAKKSGRNALIFNEKGGVGADFEVPLSVADVVEAYKAQALPQHP